MSPKKYFIAIFIIFLFAVAFAGDYGEWNKIENSNVVDSNLSSLRFFAYDKGSDNGFILRQNATYSSPILYFGKINLSQNIEYYAAFAVCDEMVYATNITDIDVSDTLGNLSENIEIYVHNYSNSNSDAHIVFVNSTDLPLRWNLSGGDGDPKTAGEYILEYDATYHIYYGTGNMRANNTNFVWIGIKIFTRNLLEGKVYDGFIYIYYQYGMAKLWYHLET